MVFTFSRNPLVPGLVVLSMLAAAGCDSRPPAVQVSPQPESETVRLLRSRTDDLLRDIALGNRDSLRQYFPPGVPVNLDEQLGFYLNLSPHDAALTNWNARSIAVEVSSDRRRARTGVRAVFQDKSGLALQKGIIFQWVSADDKGELFYLVPLSSSPY